MKENLYRILLVLVLVAMVAGIGVTAYAQPTGVGGTSGLFSRVWIIQDQGVGALNIQQSTAASTALEVGDDGYVSFKVYGSGDIVTGEDPTGGNAGAKTEMYGLLSQRLVACAQGTNGSTETTSYFDDSPIGEWAPVDATTTEAEGSVDGYYKFGASSYNVHFLATAVTGSGVTRVIAGDNWESNEYVTLLLYASEALAAGDVVFQSSDSGPVLTQFNVPALLPNIWTPVNIDISSLEAGAGNDVTSIQILLSAAGATAHAAFQIYVDTGYKWDTTDQDSLGQSVMADGVLSVIDTEGGVTLVENTDYFVDYESGTDYIVYMTNQSAADIMALVAPAH